MNIHRSIGIAVVVSVATGCATSWHHPAIGDPNMEEKQLAIDEGYCLQAAHGSVPMPQVTYNDPGSPSTQFQLSGRNYNTQTGQTTYSNYSGTTTGATSPGAGLATGMAAGMANGMNMGAAIAAKKARKKAFEGCMYAKGWSDEPSRNDTSTRSDGTSVMPATDFSLTKLKIYSSSESQWRAETEEFLMLFPAYRDSQPAYEALNREVIQTAEQSPPEATGPEILLEAHDSLVRRGISKAPQSDDRTFIIQAYRDAIAGSAVDQNALSTSYVKGLNFFPKDYRRALFWARKAALQGDKMALSGCGLMLFFGKGIEADRVNGYKLIAASEGGGAGTSELLQDLKQSMTPQELDLLFGEAG
ncbi:MAG: hypothetical protein RH947_09345 [Alcanivorax sp.]